MKNWSTTCPPHSGETIWFGWSNATIELIKKFSIPWSFKLREPEQILDHEHNEKAGNSSPPEGTNKRTPWKTADELWSGWE